tara:strand:+ start:262 stop:681 length:420 start_codon:yes stop_codon:yes gene_type:complete
MADPVTFGMDATKFVQGRQLGLYNSVRQPDNTYSPMCESELTGYIVPVGKKLVIQEISMWGSVNSFGNFNLWKHTSSGSAGGTRIYDTEVSGGATSQITWLSGDFKIKTYIEIEAGNYVNFFYSEDRGFCRLYCVECDA